MFHSEWLCNGEFWLINVYAAYAYFGAAGQGKGVNKFPGRVGFPSKVDFGASLCKI